MNQKNKCKDTSCSRLGKVGGQAVLEGVMMKAGTHSVTTCRKEDGTLVVTDASFVSAREKNKLLNFPIIRGVVNFVESLILSVKTLEASADALGLEEEEETKFEKWLKKHLGLGITKFIMILGTILGIFLAVTLFMVLPTLVGDGINFLVGGKLGAWTAIVEGISKVIIFIVYLWLVSLLPDIKRTFMYHGAEHKSIACFEAGDTLTPEAAKNYTRFHPRCGTSFMFFMILLGIIVGLFMKFLFPGLHTALYIVIRLLILPLVVGIGYEFIRFAGKHDNVFTRIFSAPGLWVQRITTKEPTPDMLEVAITSLKCALRDEYPEFMDFYRERPWEAVTEVTSSAPEVQNCAEASTEVPCGESSESCENTEAGCDTPRFLTPEDSFDTTPDAKGAQNEDASV